MLLNKKKRKSEVHQTSYDAEIFENNRLIKLTDDNRKNLLNQIKPQNKIIEEPLYEFKLILF